MRNECFVTENETCVYLQHSEIVANSKWKFYLEQLVSSIALVGEARGDLVGERGGPQAGQGRGRAGSVELWAALGVDVCASAQCHTYVISCGR